MVRRRGQHPPGTATPQRRAGDGVEASAPRRQMVAIGLAGMVLPIVLVGTALDALEDVEAAHDDVGRITDAQAHFQDADMAHDALIADAYRLLRSDRPAAGNPGAEVDRDVEAYLGFLAEVDDVPELPDQVTALLSAIRPQQEQYATTATRLRALATTDPVAARAVLDDLDRQYEALTTVQASVTDAMASEADQRQRGADAARAHVRWRVVSAALAAVVAMLGLTLLLGRLGGALGRTLARERGVAESLQRSLLPDRLPHVPGVDLAARYQPGAVGTEVGGDWYDVVPLPSGEVGLVMGDVVGHDLEAAASMGQLRNALRACAAEGADPHTVLERLNRLCLQQDLGSMATVLYAVLDPVLGTVRMASAGHYPPLLVCEDGADRLRTAEFLEPEPHPPIGAVREVQYVTTVHRLPPGSLLLLYTDGLVESRDLPVADGMARLRELAAVPVGTPDETCDALLTGMLGGRPPQDDVALLAVAPCARLGSQLRLVLPAHAEQLAVLRRTLERWLTEAGASDPEVFEITVACSEATTNAIEHAYGPGRADVEVTCQATDGLVRLTVRDWGHWREARGRDRGRGLSLMRELMDDVVVTHGERGTHVELTRRLAGGDDGSAAAGDTAAGPSAHSPSAHSPSAHSLSADTPAAGPAGDRIRA
ncbi:SpoIIE family protein phosphatase [uncultured Cellulomonas sp.]|uniref:ATP-binding SpoIIE family protein phosphatase n=1 Tax=uncultured Cellulomonas sp. TaxID=189682 RepID=UPI0026140439|nr:SpoIIE family protein phosphatase [uncultured Cellulomonas sp.]